MQGVAVPVNTIRHGQTLLCGKDDGTLLHTRIAGVGKASCITSVTALLLRMIPRHQVCFWHLNPSTWVNGF